MQKTRSNFFFFLKRMELLFLSLFVRSTFWDIQQIGNPKKSLGKDAEPFTSKGKHLILKFFLHTQYDCVIPT